MLTRLQEADELFQTMVKRFSSESKVWLNYARFLFDSLSSPTRARSLLPRALQALPAHVHVEMTSKFGLLEFQSPNGDTERGRTMFEGLVGTFPKRTDLWNVYLDHEIRVGSVDEVRDLFARVTKSQSKPKSAKYFFKKWLNFEENIGEKKRVEHVKAKAEEFVRNQK